MEGGSIFSSEKDHKFWVDKRFCKPYFYGNGGASLLQKDFQEVEHDINSLTFVDIGYNPPKNTQSNSQTSIDAVGTSKTLTPPIMAKPLTSRMAFTSYTLVLQALLINMLKILGTVEHRVMKIEQRV